MRRPQINVFRRLATLYFCFLFLSLIPLQPAQAEIIYDAPIGPITHVPALDAYKPIEEPKMAEMAPMELVHVPYKPKAPMGTAGYIPGQCVYGVALWVGVPAYMGSAYEWDEYARANGIKVLPVPEPGVVAQHDRGDWGHVALVLDVRPGEVLIKEMNWNGPWSVRTVWRPVSTFDDYIYF